jgi:hypothetical protein
LVKPVEMAAEEIAAAGDTMTLLIVDDGTDAAIATTAVEGLLNADVSGIFGPAATGVSLSVIDRIAGAEVPMCSPSNTGSIFTTYDDGGFYFRTAPPDNLQGRVHADLITEDGAQGGIAHRAMSTVSLRSPRGLSQRRRGRRVHRVRQGRDELRRRGGDDRRGRRRRHLVHPVRRGRRSCRPHRGGLSPRWRSDRRFVDNEA